MKMRSWRMLVVTCALVAPLLLGGATDIWAIEKSTRGESGPTRVIQLTTTDGWVVQGTISSGTLTLRTGWGELAIEGRRIKALSGSSFTLDDGSVIRGTIMAGKLKLSSSYGVLTIPGKNVNTITTLRETTVASTPPAAAVPAAPEPKEPEPEKQIATKTVNTDVKFVNKTSDILRVYLDDSESYFELDAGESMSQRLSVGEHRLRVRALQLLGPLAIELGSFEKTVTVEPDALIEITDRDFR